MDIKKQLLAKGFGTLLVRVLGTGLAFFLSVFLARTLGADGFGLYSFVLSLIFFLSIPLQAGFPNLIVRETAKYKVFFDWLSIKGLFFWVLKGAFLYVIGLLVVELIIHFSGIKLLDENRELIFLMGFILILLIPLLLFQNALLRGLGKIVIGIFPDAILRPGLALIIAVALFFTVQDVWSPLFAMVSYVTSICVSVIVSFLIIWSFTPKEHRSRDCVDAEISAWKKAAYPLTIVGGLQLMYSYTDIIILGVFHSNEDVGIYRAVGQLGLLVVFGLSAINQMLHSYFARLYSENKIDELQTLVTYSSFAIFLIAVIPSVLFIFASEFVLELVFGVDYIAGSTALIILTLGQLANAVFGSVGALLNMTGHERDAMKGMLYTLGVNVLLSFILIPNFGVEGAAIATAISLFVWNIILRFYVKKRLSIETIGFVQLFKARG